MLAAVAAAGARLLRIAGASGSGSGSGEPAAASERKRSRRGAMAKENATPAKRPTGQAGAFMTQSTRKRAKPAPRADEAEEEAVVPRVLESRFGEEAASRGEADEEELASPLGAPNFVRGGAAKPKLGLVGAMSTALFSPVYNLFAGGADAGGARAGDDDDDADAALAVECSAEEEAALPDEGELAVAAAPQAADEPEDDEEDFDPYLFISNLPPLHACVTPGRPPVLPRKSRRSPRNTLVLDLDETLVHSTLEALAASDFSFHVSVNETLHVVHVRRRPHLQAFMERVGALFEVVIFTASQRVYAEQLLDIIDPGSRHIRHRIFRDSCVPVDGNFLKDLTVLGRDLARTIIVDNSPQAFGFQLENGIPIESWFDDPEDAELPALLPFLERLAEADDVRPLIAQQFKLAEKVRRAGSHASAHAAA